MEYTSVRPTAIKWGGISGAISVVTSTISFFTLENTTLTLIMSFIGFVVGVLVLVLAFREYKDANGGFMSLGKGTWLGILISLISGLIGALWNIIYALVIDNELWDTLIDQSMAAIESQPGIPDSMLSMYDTMYSFTFSPVGQILIAVFGAFTGGAILSLIVAAIMKKDRD
ncbi:MAG: DUF4199 domain-containing protein [Bacteroidota bacterium]